MRGSVDRANAINTFPNIDTDTMYSPSSYDEPLTGYPDMGFSEKTVRLGFIRKVYGILMCQLIVTLGFVCLLVLEPNSKQFVRENPWFVFTVMGLTIVCMIVFACCENARRKTPNNYIVLGIFTVCMSLLVGTSASTYDADVVAISVAICAVVSFGLTIFAFQTKIDFTVLNGFLFVSLIVVFCFGIFAMIIQSRIVSLVYACLGALLFSLYLVFDTQMMIGGKHKYSISPEEYVFAALNLYLDIINLFMYILTIVGNARK